VRAWLLARSGGPDVLRLVDRPAPEPGPGQVVVHVEAIGINYAEVLSRKGLYSWAPKRPYVPGMEAVGTVEATGPGVPDRRGERVICGMQHGAYAERIALDAGQVLPVIESFSLEENAAYAVNFVTAWVALVEMARVRASDRVGVTAAAGGVGTAAVQIASALGCDVIAMAGSDSKLEAIRTLGASGSVSYGTAGFADRLSSVTGPRKLDVVLETVGGTVYRTCLQHLAPFGRIVVAGYAGLDYSIWSPLSWWRAWRDAPRLSVMKAAVASSGMLATHIGYLLRDAERLQGIWSALTDFTRAHGLRPVVGRTFPFDELPEAHRFMESRESVGKLIVYAPARAGRGRPDSPS